MTSRSIRGIAGVVLAGTLLFSDIFAFQSKAFYIDSVKVNNTVSELRTDTKTVGGAGSAAVGEAAEQDRDIQEGEDDFADGNSSPAGETEGDSEEVTDKEDEADGGMDEGAEDDIEEEPEVNGDTPDGGTEDQPDEGMTEESGEEVNEGTEEEPEEKSEDVSEEEIMDDGNGVSVSGNTVLADDAEDSVSENGIVRREAETDMGEIVGDTLPVKDSSSGRKMDSYIYGDTEKLCGEKPKPSFMLDEADQGQQLAGSENGDKSQDWAYALCSALESGIRKKGLDSAAAIDREKLTAYLYSADKDIANDKYGAIFEDKVLVPKPGQGNVNTAMWTAASGYAIKNVNMADQKYSLKNIYIYNGTELQMIKQAIAARGEVVTSIYRNEKCFQQNEKVEGDHDYRLSYHCNDEWIKNQGALMEHSVTIVGWDDTYPYINFPNRENEKWADGKTNKWDPPFNGAWLVKDSYGYDNQHYYWVSYYDYIWYLGRNCFFYSFDIAEDSDISHTYQYDGGSGISKAAYTRAVNIFPKAEQDEVLKEVSFGTLTRDAQYKVQVYLDAKPAIDGGQPVLGQPLFQDGIIIGGDGYTEWGYYTVNLEEYRDRYICEPRLSKPEDSEGYFAVEVAIINWKDQGGSGDPSLWIDGATAEGILPECRPDMDNEGQSYIYQDGKWEDLGIIRKGSNIRIKAHTQDRFTLHASADSIWRGDDLELSATIGGRLAETEGLQWRSDDEEVISVSEDGQNISVNKAGTVRLTVISGQYGSDTLEITVKDVIFASDRFLLCSNSVNKEKRQGQIKCTFYPETYKPYRIAYEVKNQTDGPYLWIDNSNGMITVQESAGSKKNIPVRVRIYDDRENFTVREVLVDCYQTPERFVIVNEEQEIREDITLKVYEERQLGIRITEPEEAVSSDLTWQSSNAAVASVNAAGKICALKEGTADVMAVSDDDPDKKAQIRVTVRPGVSRISFSESYVSLLPEESRALTVKILPEKADAAKMKYTLTDLDGNDIGLWNEWISFDPDTGILTAGSETMEQTKFRLYAECDGIKSSCFIRIDVPAQNIRLSLSPDSIVSYQTVTTSRSDWRIDPVRLYCYLEPETLSAEDVALTFHSDNPNVAQVTKTGEIVLLEAGSVSLTAQTENGLSARVQLTVQSKYASRELSLYSDDAKIYVGGRAAAEPETTTAAVTGEGGLVLPSEDFIWSSSDEQVAVVDESGHIKAVSAGWVSITAADRLDPSNRVRKTLQVGTGVREIRTKRDVVEVAKYNTVTLSCDILPANADARGVSLHAGGERIIRCSGMQIYGLKSGTTSVRLETENGFSKTVTVKVTDQETDFIEAELTRDDAAVGSITTRGTYGSEARISAEAMDQYGSTADVSQIFDYYSEDSEIAQVDDQGNVTGGNAGTTRIAVSATDGSNVSTYVYVTVQEQDSGIKSVALNHNVVELEIGEKLELLAVTLPENAPGMHEVTWSSMDETVAVVDGQGMVDAQGYGRTWIVAESMDGKKSARCEVKVLPIDSGIILSKINRQILENRQINPHAGYQIAVYANDGRDYRAYCEFISSNEDICTVDSQGKVIPADGAKTGASVITAKVKNDPLGRKVSFQVKLTDQPQAADIRLYTHNSAGNTEVDSDKPLYLPFESGDMIRLTGTAFDRSGRAMEDSSFQWKASDGKVISVKQQKDGAAYIMLKGNGSCTLTCSLRKQPQVSVSVPVYIYDRKPVLTQKKLSVNMAKKEVLTVPLQKCAGTQIEDLQLLYTKRGKEYCTGGFDITADHTNSGEYILQYHPENLKKGNYVIYAKAGIRFDDSETGRVLQHIYHNQDCKYEVLEIPVKVAEQKPKITVKQPVINVFMTDAAADLAISAGGEEIEHIDLTDGKSIGISSRFSLSKQDGKFRLRALGKEKGTYHAVLQVYVKGYDHINPISVKCTVRTMLDKPKLRADVTKIYICKEESETAQAVFHISDPLTERFISDWDHYMITEGGTIQGDRILVNGMEAYGKKTINLSVKNEDLWNGEVSLKIPVVVEKEEERSLVTDCSKITLNKRLDGDCASVSVSAKQQNFEVTDIKGVDIYNAANKLSRDITWRKADTGQNILEFRVEEGCSKGKYRVEINATVRRIEAEAVNPTRTCTKSLTLVVEEAEPAVQVKCKGTIDLYNREGTCMTGTVNVKHAASGIVDVISECDDFTAAFDAGKGQFYLKLKPNRVVSKKKQTVILRIRLSSGTELKKAVTVNMKENSLKWKKETRTIYKSMGDRSIVIPIEPEMPSGANVRLKILSVPKGMQAYTDRGKMTITLDGTEIKPGKYKVKTAAWILDSDGTTPMGSTAVRRETVIQVK